MPYTESDYPDQIKELPKGARKIWIGAYNSAFDDYDPEKDRQYDKDKSKAKNREAYASRIAWSAVKRKYKKNEKGKWVTKTLSFRVAIVKTIIRNGQRRFFFTASSDRIDLLGERLEPSIFDDFVYNFEQGYPGPILVDIAHWSYYWPQLKSLVCTGEVDQLYREDRFIKGWAFEYETALATASWEQLRRSARGELDFEISCSLGFMPDYGNVGLENDVYTYRGGRNRAFIDHLAKTAFPANLDAEIVLEEVLMGKTRKGPTPTDDARKVVGDDELVQQLEEAREEIGVPKATTQEGIVLKDETPEAEPKEEIEQPKQETPDEEELEEETEEELEEEPQKQPKEEVKPEEAPEEVRAATDAEINAQKKRAKASGIAAKEGGNITMPKKWRDAGVPNRNTSWGDWTNYKYPLHDETHVRNASSQIAKDKNRKFYSSKELGLVEGRIDKAKKKFKIGEYKEKAVYVDEVPQPYGGATSIEEAQDWREAAEEEGKVYDAWWMFQSVAENILRSEEIEDKRAAMIEAITDFRSLMETRGEIQPAETPPEAETPEVKAETKETPPSEEVQETPPTEKEPEAQPSSEQQGIRVAKSFAEAAEMILSSRRDRLAKRAALGEALVETASALEAVTTPESVPSGAPVDIEIIVKAIETGFEQAMTKLMGRMETPLREETPAPPRPQRKSEVPPINASRIITRGQTFGEIVDRLISGV